MKYLKIECQLLNNSKSWVNIVRWNTRCCNIWTASKLSECNTLQQTDSTTIDQCLIWEGLHQNRLETVIIYIRCSSNNNINNTNVNYGNYNNINGSNVNSSDNMRYINNSTNNIALHNINNMVEIVINLMEVMLVHKHNNQMILFQTGTVQQNWN